jgi:hypothetical protein
MPSSSDWKSALRLKLLARASHLQTDKHGDCQHSLKNTATSIQTNTRQQPLPTNSNRAHKSYKRKRTLRLQLNDGDELHKAACDMSPFAVSAIYRASESFTLPEYCFAPPTPDAALKCLELICASIPQKKSQNNGNSISPTASSTSAAVDQTRATSFRNAHK